MNCFICREASDFKCPADKNFLCKNHKREHERIGQGHICETLDYPIKITESDRLKSTLNNLIIQLSTTKASISSECKIIIQRVEGLMSTSLTRIQYQISYYQKLIEQQKYTNTDIADINDILDPQFNIKSLDLGPGLNLSQILISNLTNHMVPVRRSPIQFNDLDLESKKKAISTTQFVKWDPTSINTALIKDIRKSNDDKFYFFCENYLGMFNQKTGQVFDMKLVFYN